MVAQLIWIVQVCAYAGALSTGSLVLGVAALPPDDAGAAPDALGVSPDAASPDGSDVGADAEPEVLADS